MRDLPEYKFEPEASKKIYDASGQKFWARDTTHRLLVESHGHPIRGGRRVSLKPDDGNFYAYRQNTRYYPSDWVPAGIGPEGPQPARHFIGYPLDVAGDTDDFGDPTKPDIPDFSDYVLGLNADGTRLLKLARPGNAQAHLGQFLVELRDLPQLPKLLFNKLKHFSELGNEYLNAQFGWAPFVSDIQKAYRLQKTLSQKLQDLRDNNAKKLKRKRKDKQKTDTTRVVNTFPNILNNSGQALSLALFVENSLYDTAFTFPGTNPIVYMALSPYWLGDLDDIPVVDAIVERTIEEVVDTWFVGRFFYYVPDIGSDRWTQKATNALYGLNPSPSLLYQVLPWSWLVDWFGNVGDLLSNASSNAVDNELVEDPFVMKKKVLRKTIISKITYPAWTSIHFDGAFHFDGAQVTASVVVEKTTKLRKQASPYGFGISYDSLSDYQKGILLALGVSRAKF